MSEPFDQHTPVIIGVGEITDRTRELDRALEPLALMEHALRAAETDAGATLLAQVDAIDVVAEYSWPYEDAPGLLATRIGARPRRLHYGVAGGESPVKFMHEAALAISRGESEISVVVGAEAAYTVAAAMKQGSMLAHWGKRDVRAKLITGADLSCPLAVKHGVAMPTHVYPFYENAAQAHWGQTQREALAESGEIWSAFSRAAAANPHAWLPTALEPASITTPTQSNRLIAWPYTKSMVANPQVNQGAAVILSSWGKAQALGIAAEHCVFIHGGAAANEPRDYLARDQYFESHAQNVVLEAAVDIAGGSTDQLDLIELYSCFPCVPKMARRSLKLPAGRSLSVTGGLSFFGAPLNNYMTHAAASLVRGLRGTEPRKGLLYGQGEYVTKHHALVLSSRPARIPVLPSDYRLEDRAQQRRGDIPKLIMEYAGSARIETFTVVYDRKGVAEHGTVIALNAAGERLMSRVPAADEKTLAFLSDLDACPVGTEGSVSAGEKGLLRWSLA